MSNGILKVVNGVMQGEVRTMRIYLPIKLETAPATSDKAPTHKVMGKSPMGHVFQAGVAWEKSIQRGDNSGASMFSLSLEDPEFGDQPVYLTAFPDRYNPGQWNLSLERKRPAENSPQGNDEAIAA